MRALETLIRLCVMLDIVVYLVPHNIPAFDRMPRPWCPSSLSCTSFLFTCMYIYRPVLGFCDRVRPVCVWDP